VFDRQDRTDRRRAKKRDKDNNVHKTKSYPLLAGVTYLAVDDLSIDNEEVSLIESSYCSPSSLCFSTKTTKIRGILCFFF